MFEVFSTVCFFLGILHVFISNQFLRKAHGRKKTTASFTVYSYLGNAALIFGIWLIPVLIAMVITQGSSSSYDFLKSIDLIEPFAYFVLITIATIRPIQNLFDALMQKMNKLFKKRVFFFWLGIILLSSILTGIFSEIAIMTLTCIYLSTTFFKLKPNSGLTYFTFALLLLGLSVGTAILPVNFSFFQEVLNGDFSHMQTFFLFGWKVLLALALLCFAVGYFFKKEFRRLQKGFAKREKRYKVSMREIFYAFLFLFASIGKGNAFILLMVLAIVIIFHRAFYRIQGEEGKLKLYFPIVIAFFTYTLEIHASLQKWWVLPLFEQASGVTSYFLAFFLTGLNEHVPLEALKTTLRDTNSNTQFLSYLGVLAGGGLTFIAKSANIVAKLKLRHHFSHHSISPFLHLLIAIPLGLILSAILILFHSLGI